MANVGFGAKLHKASSAPQPLDYCIVASSDATAVGKGDIVKLAGDSASIGNGPRVKTVTRAATGDVVYGVIVGVEQHTVASGMSLDRTYRPASTAMYVLVRPINIDDEYVMQEDAVGGSIATSAIGQNANFVVASVNTTTGMSGTMIDSSTAATTSTLDLKLVDFVPQEDNVPGTNAKIIVRFNNIQNANQVAGV